VEKLEVGKGRKTNLIFHLTHIPNQRISLRLTYNQEKHFNEEDIEWMEKKIQEVAYQECQK